MLTLTFFFDGEITEKEEPCGFDQCGPNSRQRLVGGACICSCEPDFLGPPPNCRPECLVNSECPKDKACVRRKCLDPCVGVCGANALCKNLSNHFPP